MIQFITDSNDAKEIIRQVRNALEGGIRWVQLRMKEAPVDAIRTVAAELIPLCRRFGATVIVDDHVALVNECGFDGVHLGKHDMNPCEARKILGSGMIIGYTVNNRDDALKAKTLPIDYVGLGPLRFTSTKKNLAPVLNVEGVRELISLIGAGLPVVVIGGIVASDIAILKNAGACGVAVSGAIAHAPDIRRSARTFVDNDR